MINVQRSMLHRMMDACFTAFCPKVIMSPAEQLFTELLAAKRGPGHAQLTRLERGLERAWAVCSRWGWLILLLLALATLVFIWFRPLDDNAKLALMLLLVTDMLAWYAAIAVVTIQTAAYVVVPRVRNAHEVHHFAHARDMAMHIACYAPSDVAQVELWLKSRSERIKNRVRFILGGQITLASVFAALQSSVLQTYVSKAAAVLAPMLHMPVDRAAIWLFAGVLVLILEMLFVLSIASGYNHLLRFIDLSKVIRTPLLAAPPSDRSVAAADPHDDPPAGT